MSTEDAGKVLDVIVVCTTRLLEMRAYGIIAEQLLAGGNDMLDVEAAVEDARVEVAGILEKLAKELRTADMKIKEVKLQ